MLGTSERFRTVPNGSERFQRHLRTVSERFRGPLAVGSRVVRVQLWHGSAGGFLRRRPEEVPARSVHGRRVMD